MEGDRSAKMKQNVKTLKEMERLFREGGKVSLSIYAAVFLARLELPADPTPPS